MKSNGNNRMGTGGVGFNREDRLIGWTQIADHLQCSTSTARSWAQGAGLPVSRVVPGGRVEADRSKLTAWRDGGVVK